MFPHEGFKVHMEVMLVNTDGIFKILMIIFQVMFAVKRFSLEKERLRQYASLVYR